MGKSSKTWREKTFGPQRALSLKSRLFVLLRDELGLGRQPKVAHLLVDEILAVVEDTLVSTESIEPGQLLVLAPEIGQGPSWRYSTLEQKKLTTVRLSLIDHDDIERLAGGERLPGVRLGRMVRLVKQAYQQGATLTSCQLAMMTGISPARVSSQLRDYMTKTGEVLPTRGIVEDCSPAISHKAAVIACHLDGQTTTEIAAHTNHTPRSVERYIRRFEQVRELVGYLDKTPDPAAIARILGCSQRLISAYLDLIPPGGGETPPSDAEPNAIA